MAPVHGNGPYVFKCHGEVCHHTGAAEPLDESDPRYGQIFFVDESVGINAIQTHPANRSVDAQLLESVYIFMRDNHAYARQYKLLREVMEEEEATARQENRPMHRVQLIFDTQRAPDPRRYNAPITNEV